MVLIDGSLYDVTDPVHPRQLCRISGTSAHLFTEDTFTYVRPEGGATQVVLHSMGSGNESVVATFPLDMYSMSGPIYTPDGGRAAAMTEDDATETIHVLLASQRSAVEARVFPLSPTDCICRFGLAPPTLSFSPDGQYLVSGWPIGRGGGAQLEVQRVADQHVVQDFDLAFKQAIWGRNGHTLYVTGYFDAIGSNVTSVWTPEAGLTQLRGSATWQVEPRLSPDGGYVAYTAFTNFPADTTSVRVFVYDLAGQKTRLLTNQLRSEVLFVEDGWVWYREEVVCSAADSCPGTTRAGTKVFAMNLAAGVETPVVFAAGESPDAPYSWGQAEFWPNS
jgi:hypothetical protein